MINATWGPGRPSSSLYAFAPIQIKGDWSSQLEYHLKCALCASTLSHVQGLHFNHLTFRLKYHPALQTRHLHFPHAYRTSITSPSLPAHLPYLQYACCASNMCLPSDAFLGLQMHPLHLKMSEAPQTLVSFPDVLGHALLAVGGLADSKVSHRASSAKFAKGSSRICAQTNLWC